MYTTKTPPPPFLWLNSSQLNGNRKQSSGFRGLSRGPNAVLGESWILLRTVKRFSSVREGGDGCTRRERGFCHCATCSTLGLCVCLKTNTNTRSRLNRVTTCEWSWDTARQGVKTALDRAGPLPQHPAVKALRVECVSATSTAPWRGNRLPCSSSFYMHYFFL